MHSWLRPISAHISDTFVIAILRWPSTSTRGSSLKIYITVLFFLGQQTLKSNRGKRVTCVPDRVSFCLLFHASVLSLFMFLHLWTLGDCRAFWGLWSRDLKTMNPKELKFLQESHAGRERRRHPQQNRNFLPHRKTFPQLWRLSKWTCMCFWLLHYLFYSSVTLGQAGELRQVRVLNLRIWLDSWNPCGARENQLLQADLWPPLSHWHVCTPSHAQHK